MRGEFGRLRGELVSPTECCDSKGIKFIEEGKLTCRMMGTRRIKLIDLKGMAKASRAAGKEITKASENYGWGY